jgi:hypothetical protein
LELPEVQEFGGSERFGLLENEDQASDLKISVSA